MLSKFVCRFLAIALLALFTQVGISQIYVSTDLAIEILDDAIGQLENQSSANVPVYNGSLQALGLTVNDKISLQLMKTVKDDIEAEKDVKLVMDAWYEKANAEIAERKTKLILALDKVKELLS